MALGQIPPWLNITPQFFTQAMEAGAQIGANIGSQRRQAQQAAQSLALQREALDINAALKEVQQRNMMERAAQEQANMMERAAMQQQHNAGILGWREAALQQDAQQKLRDQALREMSIESRARGAEETAGLRKEQLAQQALQNEIMNRLREQDLTLKASNLNLGERREDRLEAPKLQKIVDEYGETKYVVTGNPLDPKYAQLESMIPGKGAGMSPQGGTQLSREQAATFLQQAGGNKEKARELARAAGYTF